MDQKCYFRFALIFSKVKPHFFVMPFALSRVAFLVYLLVFFFLKMSPHFLEISALSVGSPVIESDK
jgi:hypothetical protein